jgi:DNA-binding phage protein
MTLELTHAEVSELRDVLDEFLRTFLDEVQHTDDRELRHAMRDRYERLQGLRARIAQQAGEEANVYG